MATLASNENDTEQNVSIQAAKLQITKSLKHKKKLLCSALRYKQTRLCTCMFYCYSLCAHRHSQTRTHHPSAVCRSTQFRTAINTVVSQRGWRTASCVVEVEWLKVWVQLVVRREMKTTEMHT